MNAFRKRFIASSMFLTTTVLVIALITQGFVEYRNTASEMWTAMRLVLEPWNASAEHRRVESDHSGGERIANDTEHDFSAGGSEGPPAVSSETEAIAEQRRDGNAETAATDSTGRNVSGDSEPGADSGAFSRIYGKKGPAGPAGDGTGEEKVIAVLHNPSTGSVTLMTDRHFAISDEKLRAATLYAMEADSPTGRIGDLGVYYMRGTENRGVMISFASESYIRDRLADDFVALAIIFIGSTALLFLICLWLSKIAVKPLEKSVEMERQFVADLSHDMKTPLTVILANNSILKSNPDLTVGEQLQWIDSTDDSARNILGLVNSMLELSRLDAERSKAKLSRRQDTVDASESVADISSAAQKSVLQMESVAFERSVTLDSEITDGLLANTREDYAERICSGLIDNALKYEPRGGRVVVKLHPFGRHSVVLAVKNDISVISQEDLPHVFERFYRSDKTRDIRSGHGLGLTIIKQMADLSGAEMTVGSREGEGTVFTVKFNTPE